VSSLQALDGLNFFLAALLTGFGPFIAVHLTDYGWNPAHIGFVLRLPPGRAASTWPRALSATASGVRANAEHIGIRLYGRSLGRNRSRPAVGRHCFWFLAFLPETKPAAKSGGPDAGLKSPPPARSRLEGLASDFARRLKGRARAAGSRAMALSICFRFVL
jgi:hypothetical protein